MLGIAEEVPETKGKKSLTAVAAAQKKAFKALYKANPFHEDTGLIDAKTGLIDGDVCSDKLESKYTRRSIYVFIKL